MTLPNDVAKDAAAAWRFSPYPAAPKFRVLTEDPDAAQFARDCGVAVTELFTAPPAPAVPDEKPRPHRDVLTYLEHWEDGYAEGWNACRTAMLATDGKASVQEGWKLVADFIKADEQHGAHWLALKDGRVTFGEYEWCQGWNPDGWNTPEGRLGLGSITHCAPYRKPAHPLAAPEVPRD